MAKQLSDDELGALIDAELRNAVGFFGGKLAQQRQKAEQYFYAEAKGDLAPPEIEGRSSVVVPVVRNTIEAMLPQLMVKFTGGDTVVEFEPTQQGDEQAAKNCTEYLNYLFFKKNPGHSITYSWFKDALKLKRGFVKVWWDTRDEESREEYKGLDQVELAQLMDDEEIEILEQKSYPDEEDAEKRKEAIQQLTQQCQQAEQAAAQGNQQAAQACEQMKAQIAQIQSQPAAMLYDVSCKRTKTGGKVTIENVPPEEFFISRRAKSIADARICGHRFKRTISHLRSMGYPSSKIDQVGSGGDESQDANLEFVERMAFDDEYTGNDNPLIDESQREVWVTEAYVRVDKDGDGIAELRKVTRCGGVTLDDEVTDMAPFVSICPIPEPHKFYGLSVADLAQEGQKTETALLRASLDNLYLEVNGRYFAVEGQVNLDDLLSSRPGGIVRTKSQGAVGRLDQGKGNIGETMSMLEYMKAYNEDATGWSRLSMGNDPNSLNGGETATKTNIVTNKADMRVDLIARNFAEGFVELFRLMLKLVCQHQDKEAWIKLSGQWVPMDPREWRNQFDVNINVGLGMGSKDQQVAHLMTLIQTQANGLQIGITTPSNLYESAMELAKNLGFKSGQKFFTQPDPNAKPPDPMQGQMQIEQMKAQVKAQSDQQAKMGELQLERERMQMQAQVDTNRQQVEAQQQAAKAQMEMQLQREKFQQEMQLEQLRIQAQAQVQVEIARINAQSKIDAAQVTAQSTLTPEQETAADNATHD